MTTTPDATPQALLSEAQLQQMAAEIRQEIPGAEVRLFGSHARGEARADSDIDLLITANDGWLAQHRVEMDGTISASVDEDEGRAADEI